MGQSGPGWVKRFRAVLEKDSAAALGTRIMLHGGVVGVFDAVDL